MSRSNALPGPDDVLRITLPNGIVVLARENFASQSVVIGGSLQVGSIYEPLDKAGIAAFTASALMRGTRNRDFNTLHGTLEELAASIGIGGGVHSTSFSGKALAEDLPTLLTLLSDVLRYPAFPVDHTERLRAEILTGMRLRQQDTRSVAGESFRKLLYATEHPYSRNLQGSLDVLPTITLDDMAAFHGRHFGPRGMVIVLVGAVQSEQAVRLVQDAFGGWANPAQPERPPMPDAATPSETRQEFTVVPGKSQSDLCLGWIGPSRFADDFLAANLANNILGVFGMMGRLGKSVREDQGLAYHASSRLGGGLGPAPWNVVAGVHPANVQKAITSIRDEIRRITAELVAEEELDDNKANFTGRLPITLESNEGVAGSILNMETYQLGLDYLRRYNSTIHAITREQVLTAAQTYLKPDAYVLAVAGPELEDNTPT